MLIVLLKTEINSLIVTADNSKKMTTKKKINPWERTDCIIMI